MCILHKNMYHTYHSLVRNKNVKRPGFQMLHVTRAFSKFPRLKQLKKQRTLVLQVTKVKKNPTKTSKKDKEYVRIL